MIKSGIVLLFSVAFASIKFDPKSPITAEETIDLGTSAFKNGLNMPWYQCGNDWGIAYDHDTFDTYYAKYNASGADTLRQWIHYDGAKQLSLYDSSGNFKTLPDKFYSDAKDNLQLAKQYNIKLHLTLFSFECASNSNCYDMVTDSTKSQSYINNGLRPFLDFIKTNGFSEQISVIEMFNEPEWMIPGTGGQVSKTMDLTKAQQFMKSCNDVITSSGFQATVGSASLKWSCSKGHWCVGDWWAQTGITFRTIHYYSWMAQGGNQFDPFSTTPSDWGLDSDVLIGESPAYNDETLSHGTITVENQFWYAHQNGWAGVLPWADVGSNNYPNINAGLKCKTNLNACKPGQSDSTEQKDESTEFLPLK